MQKLRISARRKVKRGKSFARTRPRDFDFEDYFYMNR